MDIPKLLQPSPQLLKFHSLILSNLFRVHKLSSPLFELDIQVCDVLLVDCELTGYLDFVFLGHGRLDLTDAEF